MLRAGLLSTHVHDARRQQPRKQMQRPLSVGSKCAPATLPPPRIAAIRVSTMTLVQPTTKALKNPKKRSHTLHLSETQQVVGIFVDPGGRKTEIRGLHGGMSGICVRRTLDCVQGARIFVDDGITATNALLECLKIVIGVLLAYPVPQRCVRCLPSMPMALGCVGRPKLPRFVRLVCHQVQGCWCGPCRTSVHGAIEPQAPLQAGTDRHPLIRG